MIQPQVIFAKLKSDNEPFVIESLCINCRENGTTTMLLTSIPSFREIVVVSFFCEHCGYKNSQIQFGGELADQGLKITFKVEKESDTNREFIKSEHATIRIPEIDFEIPCNKKGEITTFEGLLDRCIDEISKEQPHRKIVDESLYDKLEVFLVRLNKLKVQEGMPFTVIIDDPSGLSFIKNPFAPKSDPQMRLQHYNRTTQQIQAMGYSVENTKEDLKQRQGQKVLKVQTQLPTTHKIDMTKPFDQNDLAKNQALVFEVPCHVCKLMGQTRMCETSVPYFKDLIIMAFSCEHCGAISSEVKTSGPVEEKGVKITVKNPKGEDLKRDLFKSDSCGVQIPELELELDYGTLGGVLTTIEGLLEKIHDHLDQTNPFADSDKQFGKRMKILLDDLTACRNGQKDFTLILQDPMSHSFLQNPHYPALDPIVTIEYFERTEAQNDFLGLLDMKVENYN